MDYYHANDAVPWSGDGQTTRNTHIDTDAAAVAVVDVTRPVGSIYVSHTPSGPSPGGIVWLLL